ncbi:serine hydrolase [Kribbella deserti]|uniref:Serine hydrolase n=1 Tax=Kribbella deserti TaxID=1926257 RepID=A0ABV6QM52_9ACTN
MTAEIDAVFAAAGATGFLHAREVGVADGPEVSVRGDEPVVLASVFKIPVAVAYAREVAAGWLDPSERTTVTARYRVGGIGTAGCSDDVEMSWRDLARNMLTMSDNAATDVIFHQVGQETVDQVLADLGLKQTQVLGCCEDLLGSLLTALNVGMRDDPDEALKTVDPEVIWSLDLLDPARTTSSTPREMTTLLNAIWTDQAATAEACASVRDIMADQIWPHRMTSGFENGVRIAAKTGTLPSVRNEAGVVTYPDGRQYAVAVFTRAKTLDERQPAIDASIGRAARLAVEQLRAAARS